LRSVGHFGWEALTRLGLQAEFYARTLASVADAVVRYRTETLRLIAQMSLSVGALAVVGGTVGIVGFMTLAIGTITSIQAYTQFQTIGAEALTGFAAAFFGTRLLTPVVTGIALAATIGAGATAQIGAMRINEEIDALEVIGIRSVAYLASSRVVAGVVVVLPLFSIAMVTSYVATRLCTTMVYGQSRGVYDHYFNTFLQPMDLVWALVQAVAMAVVIMLIHTFYGFTASGGPAGVGQAVGRSVRASLIVATFVIVLLSLAIYGQSGNFRLSI
jgi:phospholipid/cholesterol/gamma-HCH transport system permease protein